MFFVASMSTKPRTTPLPGRSVRGSKTGRPLMAAFDLLGRRWTLRVMWELRENAATFRELRERCDDVSPAVLNTRTAELREAGLLELSEQGYRTTELGASLLGALAPLDAWAARWAKLKR
jgi:DNA-binding HxlR family transcriptional regulator